MQLLAHLRGAFVQNTLQNCTQQQLSSAGCWLHGDGEGGPSVLPLGSPIWLAKNKKQLKMSACQCC